MLIDITKDAQLEKLDFKYKKCEYIRSYNPHIPLHTKAIESAAIMINHAERPLILAGHGVLISGAEEELRHLLKKQEYLLLRRCLDFQVFLPSHRLFTGMLGMHGNYGPEPADQ